MAEKRMLSRRASKSKKLAAVSYQTEALYYRAIPFLDDAGRVTADTEDFRAEILPLGKRGRQVPLSQIEAAIQEMYDVGLVGLCTCEKTRCMEYANFHDFQTLQSDRKPKVACLEPVGIQWNPMESNGIPNLYEGKLYEEKGDAREATPPEIQELIHNAHEIKGWTFTEDQDAEFFPRLLATFSQPLIARVIEDLRTYQEKPAKAYKNLHATLRNWCKLELDRHPGNGSRPDVPTDDLGLPMVPLNGKHYTQKQIDDLVVNGKVQRTKDGYRLAPAPTPDEQTRALQGKELARQLAENKGTADE